MYIVYTGGSFRVASFQGVATSLAMKRQYPLITQVSLNRIEFYGDTTPVMSPIMPDREAMALLEVA